MSKRVLIVDDEENIRQMIRLTLEAAGYVVGEARSGMEVFTILGGTPSWDVILLDQKMPGMVGTDVLRRIKVLAPESRVIMVTAFAEVELAVEAMKLGATDFVRKPMTPEILRNAVAAAEVKAAEAIAPAAEKINEPKSRGAGTLTLNGFTILRASDMRVTLPHKRNEQCFIVRHPDGQEQEVVVEISDEAFREVEQATHHLPPGKAFWTEQAERFLSDFIWNDGNVPGDGKITLRGVEPEELKKAAEKGQDL